MKLASAFIAGLLTGLASTGLLLVLISEPRGEPVELIPPPTPRSLTVHVAGAVREPGVYTLPRGSIVQQAIETAGGPRPGARLDLLNLAELVENGQRIFIPAESEATVVPQSAGSPAAGEDSEEMINLNTASAPQLEALPGIGPSLAQKIVDHRDLHGPFLEIADLLDVSGIGPAKLEQIRGRVTLR